MCTTINDKKDEFIIKIETKLKEADKENKDTDKRLKIIKDIHTYSHGGSDYETNQEALGFKNLFRGIIIQE